MIHTSVNAARRLGYQRGRGDVTLDDIAAAMDALHAREEFEADFGVVWDLRDARIECTLRDIITLDPAVIDQANDVHGAGKAAWVLGSVVCETMIQMLYRHYRWAPEWRTFTKVEAAQRWCGGDGPDAQALQESRSGSGRHQARP